MVNIAVRAIAIGNEVVATGFDLQHEREIFSAHGRLLLQHIVRAHNAGHHGAGKLGLFGAVDGGRIVAEEFELAAQTKGCAGVLGNLPHAGFDHVEHLHGEGAHGAAQLAAVGDDIGGLTGMDHGDRNHAGVDGFFVARDDGLKGLHHLAGHGHRVQTIVRQGGMSPLAPNDHLEFIAGGHHRPRADSKLAHLGAGPVVHAKHGVHGKLLKQTVLDHLARTTTALFGRLENQVNRAVKQALLGKVLRGCEQHGGVTVMAAGVHLAFVLAGVAEGVELLHGQGVHVGAQANGALRGAIFDNAHHAGGA